MWEHMETSIETIRKLVSYDPESGALTWLRAEPEMFADGVKHSAATRCKIWNAKYSGKPALTYREASRPYAYGDILGRKYYAHRVAFALMTGEWPDLVDHLDGDQTNNAWANLRGASRSENSRNCYLRSDNASGHPGVYWDASRNQWAAELHQDGVKRFLGRYETLADAVSARAAVADCTPRHGSKRPPSPAGPHRDHDAA
jgi:hypothetical protein